MAANPADVCTSCGTPKDSSSCYFGCAVCLLQTGLNEAAKHDDAPAPIVEVPEQLGAYIIARHEDGSAWELGRGAMGVTYRAIDPTLDRPVALKIVQYTHRASNAETRERFVREARAAASLRHPNVATVYQFGIREETGQCFYAMELVEGETLDDRVRRSGPLDARTTLEVAVQVTDALATAEKRGLVHRDLKPGNLMAVAGDEKEEQLLVKVIDFGVAKAITRGTDAMALTHGGFVGTPAFASPEQFARGPVDVRSDIYSLGVTLWFLLTGQMPFRGSTVDELREAQRASALPIVQLKAARVPPAMVFLIVSMLSLEPAARPSVAALTARLQKCRQRVARGAALKRRFVIAAALLATALAFFLTNFLRSRSTFDHSGAGESNDVRPRAWEKSIAVLPFVNVSREPENAYFADGIRTQIVARLSKVADLKLISDSSSHRFPTSSPDVRQVAAELDVANVLQGKVEKKGDGFKVAVRLIDGKSNLELWKQSYDRNLSNILQIETEVAREVAGALRLTLTEAQRRAINVVTTSDPQAYEAYLKGRYVWLRRTIDAYLQAIEYFNQAIGIDPNYARAYAGLGDAYQFLAASTLHDRKDNYEKAKSAYRQALDLDPTLAEAHASVGLMAMNYDWNWALAEEEFRRAIALDPNYGLAYDWYAEYLMAVGRPEESLKKIERARELDPFSIIINSDVGKMLFFARLYDAAEAQLKETIRMAPDFGQAHNWLGQVHATKGRFDEAIAEFAIGEREGSPWAWGLMAYTYGMAGRRADAERMLDAMKKHQFSRGAEGLWLAHAYIGLDDKDRAIACLEQDYESHSTTMTGLKSYPWFDSLRSDLRFIDLMRRVHLAP